VCVFYSNRQNIRPKKRVPEEKKSITKKKNPSQDFFHVQEKNSVLFGLFICFLSEIMVPRRRVHCFSLEHKKNHVMVFFFAMDFYFLSEVMVTRRRYRSKEPCNSDKRGKKIHHKKKKPITGFFSCSRGKQCTFWSIYLPSLRNNGHKRTL